MTNVSIFHFISNFRYNGLRVLGKMQNIIETKFNDDEVGNGAYRSILSLLDIVVSILIKSESPILKVSEAVLNPSHQYR
ncbi:hypothetical protein C1646_762124 [Rhizophagus diaphanus]|nr:hypothetical protein C1646_762124 [Rhizophagus diaphanus] [Rhizophagus sp. MUCL 43196]